MTLPTGLVTFVFSDIEGSTRMWEADADTAEELIRTHDQVAHAAIESAGGTVFKHTGDGFGAVFGEPADALRGAVAVQDAITNLAADLAVRIGVHAGEAVVRLDDYFGPDLARTVRLMDAANGGQIAVSGSVHEMVGGAAPDGTHFIELGPRRLRDLSTPMSVYRLGGGVLTDHRPLRTLDHAVHNLPIEVDSFVGRDSEIEAVTEKLSGNRIVTLTGIGGVGKTRLALQVAAGQVDRYADGVWFVELAPVVDPSLLPAVIGNTIDAPSDTARPALDRLLSHVAGKSMLLVLDNCEHLIDDLAEISVELLQASAQVQILATSREGLAIDGESIWRVPSLPVDGEGTALTLFEARARQVWPGFEITDDNRKLVAELCERLDGIPLAIELATARLKVMDLEQIMERLGDRFRLLTGTSRSATERQRTLRAMMDWSYKLLPASEQTLLQRLSVFAGTFAYEAAESVGAGTDLDTFAVLDALTHLVDASLVSYDGSRYRMLETVRQYAQDELADSGGADDARLAHAEWYVQMTETAVAKFSGDGFGDSLKLFDAELPNIRGAIGWSYAIGRPDLGLRTAVATRLFMFSRAYNRESLQWLIDGLPERPDPASEIEVRAVAYGLAEAFNVDDHYARARIAETASRLLAEVEDPVAKADLLNAVANHTSSFDYDRAEELYREAIALYREAGSDRWPIPVTNRVVHRQWSGGDRRNDEILELTAEAEEQGLGSLVRAQFVRVVVAMTDGDHEQAIAMAEEAEPHDEWERAMVHIAASSSMRALGRFDDAHAALDEADKEFGETYHRGTLWSRMMAEIEAGSLERAAHHLRGYQEPAIAPTERAIRASVGLAWALIAHRSGDLELAARLAGYGLTEKAESGWIGFDHDNAIIDRGLAEIRDALGEERYQRLVAEGAAADWIDLEFPEI